MLFDKEINDLLTDFYSKNKNVVQNSLFGSLINFIIDSIIMPRIMAKLFVSINDKKELKNNVIKLMVTWTVNQASHAIADTMRSKLEPSLTKYLTDVIVDNIFIKYQNTNGYINTAIVFSKIGLIRWTIESLVDNILLVIIPRTAIIYITIFNFYTINKKLGLCALFAVTIQLMIVFSSIDKCINIAYDEIEVKDNALEYIEDKISNIHTITSVFNGIKNESKNCHKQSSLLYDKKVELNNCVLERQISGYTTNTIVFIIILMYGYNLHKDNELDKEQFITLLTTLESLFMHVYEITYIFPDVTARFGVLKNNQKFIAELFSHKNKIGREVSIKNGIVEFNNVTFGYKKNNNIFDNYTIKIEPGITGIYGKSGSGKSTMIKLICNIIKPLSGIIKIDGHNINDISFNCLNKNIVYISQNTSTLFDTTVYDNITYGLNSCQNNLSSVKNFIQKYKLWQIFENINKNITIETGIKNNFNFLNYPVGKRGELLSGGQRQILHIIRSILNNTSKIYIYDEPTSALDENTKQNVINMIKTELKDKTVLMITHDTSIRHCCTKIIEF